jgi:predicted aspartyl protease
VPNVWQLAVATGALAAILCFCAASEAHGDCKIQQVAEFHVENIAGSPMIEGEVNGQPVKMLLETGSVMTYVTLSAARQLGLSVHEYTSRAIFGVGENEEVEGANVKQLRIDQLALKDHPINVVETQIHDGGGVASFQLSADFFSHFVTEFDLAHNVVRLLSPKDCKLDQLAYWSPEFFKADLQRYSFRNPQFVVKVKVNGKEIEARLVSGSATSYISLGAAKDAGIEPGSAGVQPSDAFIAGSMKTPIPTWVARFDTFELGGETIKNAHLHLGDVFPHGQRQYTGHNAATQITATYEIKLGSDFFQAHRLVIVPDQNAVLFTYNGGAVS